MASETKYSLPRVMTVKELSDYLRVHPSDSLQTASSRRLAGLSDRHRLAFQRRGDRPLVPAAKHESFGRRHVQPELTRAFIALHPPGGFFTRPR